MDTTSMPTEENYNRCIKVTMKELPEDFMVENTLMRDKNKKIRKKREQARQGR